MQWHPLHYLSEEKQKYIYKNNKKGSVCTISQCESEIQSVSHQSNIYKHTQTLPTDKYDSNMIFILELHSHLLYQHLTLNENICSFSSMKNYICATFILQKWLDIYTLKKEGVLFMHNVLYGVPQVSGTRAVFIVFSLYIRALYYRARSKILQFYNPILCKE